MSNNPICNNPLISKKKILNEYKKQFKHYLLTSRFNNNTWNENETYRQKHKNIGCIYCSPDIVCSKIPLDTILFILEMNNDTNKIIGIGMIRNRPISGKYFVYDEGNYNRYVFVGRNRISRHDMTEEEDQIMQVFDILCFKGNKHMKRGQGLKSFPVEMLYNCNKKLDLVNYISEMFKRRLLINKENENIKI